MDPFFYYLNTHSQISTALDVYRSSIGVITEFCTLQYQKAVCKHGARRLPNKAILISRLISAHAQNIKQSGCSVQHIIVLVECTFVYSYKIPL